jgi:hypothetical protein
MHTRQLCSDLITVEWRAELDAVQRVPAVLKEVSARRACLLLEHPIPAKTLVRLICGTCRLRGEVSYCLLRGQDRYRMAVLFTASETWSPDRCRPEHLVDLRTLPSCSQAGECTASTCDCGGQTCPHANVQRAAGQARSTAESIRAVAREVAKVCRNLDPGLLTDCFRRLFGSSRPEELLAKFIAAYEETRRAAAPDKSQLR